MLSLYTDLEVRVRDFAKKAARQDEGAGIVEYLLLVVFIALVMIAALALFTGALGSAFGRAGILPEVVRARMGSGRASMPAPTPFFWIPRSTSQRGSGAKKAAALGREEIRYQSSRDHPHGSARSLNELRDEMDNIFARLVVWAISTSARKDDEVGAGIVEYLLLVLFIALAMILALTLFAGALTDAFGEATSSIPA